MADFKPGVPMCDGALTSPSKRLDDLTPPDPSSSIGAGKCAVCRQPFWLGLDGLVPAHGTVGE